MNYYGRITMQPLAVAQNRGATAYREHLLMRKLIQHCAPVWHASTLGGLRRIVFVSGAKPELPPDSPILVEIRPYPEEMLEASRFGFEILLANRQTRHLPGDAGNAERRYAFRSKDALLQWFPGFAAAQGGFEVKNPMLQKTGTVAFSRRNTVNDKYERIAFRTAEFAGELKVIDRERFRSAVFNGLGKKKSYGCGLRRIFPI